MTDSLQEDLFLEPKSSFGLKVIGAIAALVVTISLLAGYAYLRQRHAEKAAAAQALIAQREAGPPKLSPKALVLVDEALLQGNKTVVGGTVKNTSTETLRQVTVALELKHRKDAATERKVIALTPTELEPGQEGRYSLELKAADYGSARLVGVNVGGDASPIAYNSAIGRKRPLERMESKPIIVGRPPPKPGAFLNSPDNPTRVP
jgi:hypothetical protein